MLILRLLHIVKSPMYHDRSHHIVKYHIHDDTKVTSQSEVTRVSLSVTSLGEVILP